MAAKLRVKKCPIGHSNCWFLYYECCWGNVAVSGTWDFIWNKVDRHLQTRHYVGSK